jgi:hypothetical protein
VGARTEYKEEGRFSEPFAVYVSTEVGANASIQLLSAQPLAISLQQSAFSNQPGSAFFASPAAKITLGRVLTAES